MMKLKEIMELSIPRPGLWRVPALSLLLLVAGLLGCVPDAAAPAPDCLACSACDTGCGGADAAACNCTDAGPCLGPDVLTDTETEVGGLDAVEVGEDTEVCLSCGSDTCPSCPDASCPDTTCDCQGCVGEPPCLVEGVCLGLVKISCQSSEWICDYSGVLAMEEEESLCDGLDNDCDGLVDEGLCQTCTPGAVDCEGTGTRVCNPGGNDWQASACPGGTTCMGPGECTATEIIRFNQETFDDQTAPVAVRLDQGDYGVAWQSYGQDGSNLGVYLRFVSPDGLSYGDELQVNQATLRSQADPALAPLEDGGLVAAWTSQEQFGDEVTLMARAFPELSSEPGELVLSMDPTYSALTPALASVGERVAVVWEGGPASQRDIFLRWLDRASGMPLGQETVVSQGISVRDIAPQVLALSDSVALVVWESGGLSHQLMARLAENDGSFVGVPVTIASESNESYFDVQGASQDAFSLVMWNKLAAQEICGQIYDDTLSSVGEEFCLAPSSAEITDYKVTADGLGGFLVAWHDRSVEPARIVLTPVGPDGVVGDEVVVVTSQDSTLGAESDLALSRGVLGKVLVLWTASEVSGSGKEVFGRFLQVD